MDQIFKRMRKELSEKGYTILDLADNIYITDEDVNQSKNICMDRLYQNFANRGVLKSGILVDVNQSGTSNPFFMCEEGSALYNAMYYTVSETG